MDYQDSKIVRGKALDFADSLIARKAHYIADESGQELEAFYSFDKAVAQLKGARTP
jgi:hypothetical protein